MFLGQTVKKEDAWISNLKLLSAYSVYADKKNSCILCAEQKLSTNNKSMRLKIDILNFFSQPNFFWPTQFSGHTIFFLNTFLLFDPHIFLDPKIVLAMVSQSQIIAIARKSNGVFSQKTIDLWLFDETIWNNVKNLACVVKTYTIFDTKERCLNCKLAISGNGKGLFF